MIIGRDCGLADRESNLEGVWWPSPHRLAGSSELRHRGTIALVMPQPTPPRLIRFSTTGFLVSAAALILGGCRGTPPPAAASNENFAGSGVLSAPGIDDRWASVVLDEAARREVLAALRDAVSGETTPLRAAEFGVRFEDVPRAILTAAPTIEMAVVKQALTPAMASVNFLDPSGLEAVASIDLRRMTAIANVEYLIPGDDVALLRASLLDSINGLLWSNDTFFAGGTAHRRASAREGEEGVQAIQILEEAVRRAGGTIGDRAFKPERYRIDLSMLDDQPARIEVQRESDPQVLSWKVWAGTFPMPEKAAALGAAFDEALRAWGRTPSPVAARGVVGERD